MCNRVFILTILLTGAGEEAIEPQTVLVFLIVLGGSIFNSHVMGKLERLEVSLSLSNTDDTVL